MPDRVLAETDGDGLAECWLHEKGLPWAAELLSRWPGDMPGANEPFPPSHAIAAE